MKRVWFLFLGLGLAAPLVAQTVGVNVVWDPPLATETIQSYNLYVDSAPAVSVPVTVNASCACIKAPIGVAVGSHTVRVADVYLLIDTDPTSAVEGPPATVTFTINGGGQIRNIKVTK